MSENSHSCLARAVGIVCLAATTTALADDLPRPINNEHFSALKKSSPFERSVGLTDSIILTGIARVGERTFASLIDTETTESFIVSTSTNSEGWQLVDVKGDDRDLETLTAKIQVGGGEVISIRYDKKAVTAAQKPGSRGRDGSGQPLTSGQLKEAKEAAINYRKGFSSDGYPKEPPPDMVKKLSRISAQKREEINRKMIELRNRGLGMDERRKIYVDSVDRAVERR